ncbi:MAG: hypothetical protein AAF333_02415 [Planctomycetota bacterium]
MAFTRTPNRNPDAHRRHALCSALALWADDLQRLAKRHPDADRLLAECLEVTPTTLDRLLWDELEARESATRRGPRQHRAPAAQPRTAPGYWVRRRRLAVQSELQSLVRVLPDLWRVLMDRKPAQVEAFAVRVGLACLALSDPLEAPNANGLESDPFELDPDTDHRVRQIASSLDEITLDTDLLRAWRGAFGKQARRTTPDKALRALGMSVLSGLFQRMPAPTRAAMARHFQSSLCVSLSAGRPLHKFTPVEAELLEASFVRLFGHEDTPRGPELSSPPRGSTP